MSVYEKLNSFFEDLGKSMIIKPKYGLENLKGDVELIGYIGFDSLFESRQELIRFGVKHELISQKKIDKLNDQYIKKSIPRSIESLGIDDLGPISQKQLEYGLSKGLFTQKKIEKSQEAYRTRHAKNTFSLIRNHGLDFLTERGKRSLLYGVEKGLFTQTDIDKAQEAYHTMRRFSNIIGEGKVGFVE